MWHKIMSHQKFVQNIVGKAYVLEFIWLVMKIPNTLMHEIKVTQHRTKEIYADKINVNLTTNNASEIWNVCMALISCKKVCPKWPNRQSIGVKSWLANKGITIEWFQPIMLREFNGDSFASKSRFDTYANHHKWGIG